MIVNSEYKSKKIEPLHRMYLNITIFIFIIITIIIEPLHRMYLNLTCGRPAITIVIIEPLHRMYLNNDI